MRLWIPALACLALAGCDSKAPEPEASAPPSATPTAAAAATPSREDDIRHFLLQEFPEAAPMKYALAWKDLNGDGADEAIVYLVTSYFCGSGGCNTLVLTQAGPMWRKVGEISVSRTPVTVLPTKSQGWSDLTVDVSGGGMPGGIALLKFDGETYPDNPTVAPALSAKARGEELIAEQPALVELAAAPSGE